MLQVGDLPSISEYIANVITIINIVYIQGVHKRMVRF